MLDVLVQGLCGVILDFYNFAPDTVHVSVTGRATAVALAVLMLETLDTLQVICQLPAPHLGLSPCHIQSIGCQADQPGPAPPCRPALPSPQADIHLAGFGRVVQTVPDPLALPPGPTAPFPGV